MILTAVLLLGVGLALVVAEVLFPSFGVLSILATASIVGAVALAFSVDTGTGVQFLVAVALLVPTAIVLGFKVLPNTPIGRRLTVTGLSFESAAATDDRDLALVGREGVVEAVLRPAGMARIDGRRVDVVSRGEMIEAGERVRVVDVRGNRVVVARAPGGPPADPPAGSPSDPPGEDPSSAPGDPPSTPSAPAAPDKETP